MRVAEVRKSLVYSVDHKSFLLCQVHNNNVGK